MGIGGITGGRPVFQPGPLRHESAGKTPQDIIDIATSKIRRGDMQARHGN